MIKGGQTVVSLFSGLGGLDLGFQLAGFKTIWANEISENASKSYEQNFGLRPHCGDITQISDSDIPNADIVIGGPPCQSFSLVGQRRPDDDRGKLVFRFRDIVLSKMPQAFVMENVPGLASSRVGRLRLHNLLAEQFSEAGYFVTVTKLIATDYLVPQRRSRIFILGSRTGHVEIPNPDAFASECYGILRSEVDLSAKAAISDLGPPVSKGQLASYNTTPTGFLANILRQNNGETVSLHESPRMSDLDKEFIKHIPPGGNYLDIPDEISTKRIMKFKASGGRTTTYGRLHPDQPSYTINTYFRRPNVGCNFHYSEPRLITPREAMRFQCFPDRFKVFYGSQDERNAYIGNAVPPILAHAVGWTLRNCLEGRSGGGNFKQQRLPFTAGGGAI